MTWTAQKRPAGTAVRGLMILSPRGGRRLAESVANRDSQPDSALVHYIRHIPNIPHVEWPSGDSSRVASRAPPSSRLRHAIATLTLSAALPNGRGQARATSQSTPREAVRYD